MTFPGPRGDADEPDRLPTQAELDAQDLAEMAANPRETDLTARYPRRPADPGPPPRALTRDAVVTWWIALVAAVVCLGYGFANRSRISDWLEVRLEPEMAGAQRIDDSVSAESMAAFWPPALLIGWVIAMAVTYPLLRGIARHHSRNLRSIYAAVAILIALFLPLISDLLFGYPEVPQLIRVLVWVSVGALLLSMLMTFRGVVGRWLPESMRLRPSRVWREK